MSNHFEQDELLRQIEAALKPLMGAGNHLDVASDPEHAYELLANSPRGWRLVVGWQGYEEHEESRISAIYDAYYFVVQIGEGLDVRPGRQTYVDRPGGSPNLMDLIQKVDGWVRGMRFAGGGVDQAGFQPQGGDWLALEDGSRVRAKQFRLQYRLPRILPATEEIAEGTILIKREN